MSTKCRVSLLALGSGRGRLNAANNTYSSVQPPPLSFGFLMKNSTAVMRSPPGWLRLWLLVVVLWLLFVVVFFARGFPSEELLRERKLASNESVLSWSDPKTFAHTRCGSVEGTIEYIGCLKSANYAGKVAAYHDEKERLAATVEPYIQEHLLDEQLNVAGFATLWWLLPSIFLLALFAALRWVVRGFAER
jgi:hypothetical protein